MPPKGSTAAANRRKSAKAAPAASTNGSNGTSSAFVTVKITPDRLRAIVDPVSAKKEPSPSKESPATSVTVTAANGTENPYENPSDPNTPAAAGTPTASGAPGVLTADPFKKKGVKRAAPGTNGESKPRGKPGPKKKARLEDGSIDPNAPKTTHKLGPKANQGAINAGLRALDRTGKPTRKWTKGSFKLKSFTGEVWEIPRWRTAPKPKPDEPVKDESATASAAGSNKEVKDTPSQEKSDNTPSNADVEMKDVPMSSAADSPAPAPTNASTPALAAPVAIAAAS